MIFDTHCHYNLEPLYSGKPSHFKLDPTDPLLRKDWQQHWQKAQREGLIGSLITGTNLETSELALKIAQQDKKLYAAIGLHPGNADNFEVKETITQFEKLIAKHDQNLVAIGETGLDYYRLDKNSPEYSKITQQQKEFFIAQIKLAQKHQLPIIIHVRDKKSEYGEKTSAYSETLRIIEEHFSPEDRFVLHCISGPLSYLIQAVELGAYVGVCANVTYKKADELRSLVEATPVNRLLLETDAPYLPPQEFRGQVCEPWMISKTGQFLEKELGIKPTWLIENTEEFLGIKI